MDKLIEELIGKENCDNIENSIILSNEYQDKHPDEHVVIPNEWDLLDLSKYIDKIKGKILKGKEFSLFSDGSSDERDISLSLFRITGADGNYLIGDLILTNPGGKDYYKISRDSELYIYSMSNSGYRILDEEKDEDEINIVNLLFNTVSSYFRHLNYYINE